MVTWVTVTQGSLFSKYLLIASNVPAGLKVWTPNMTVVEVIHQRFMHQNYRAFEGFKSGARVIDLLISLGNIRFIVCKLDITYGGSWLDEVHCCPVLHGKKTRDLSSGHDLNTESVSMSGRHRGIKIKQLTHKKWRYINIFGKHIINTSCFIKTKWGFLQILRVIA